MHDREQQRPLERREPCDGYRPFVEYRSAAQRGEQGCADQRGLEQRIRAALDHRVPARVDRRGEQHRERDVPARRDGSDIVRFDTRATRCQREVPGNGF
jgi:hypothetical protein